MSNGLISKEGETMIFVVTKCFNSLDSPVILTSGKIGIYYVNTEKTLEDGGKFEQFGDQPHLMIQHALDQYASSAVFKTTIDSLDELIQSKQPGIGFDAIAGGQRRDWPFSGVVAHLRGVPHISIFKPKKGMPDRLLYSQQAADAGLEMPVDDLYLLNNKKVLLVTDLMTEGSSCYSVLDSQEVGWVPALRRKGAVVQDLVTVVSRLEGGEELLAGIGVGTYAVVKIDENFLRAFSPEKHLERNLDYMADPELWGDEYIRMNGATPFIELFNPEGGKIDRARKFKERYLSVLSENGGFRVGELRTAVELKYDQNLDALVGK